MTENLFARDAETPQPAPADTGGQQSPGQNPGSLAGHRVAFTGILASMTHRAAMQLVEQHGGVATEHVSRQTTMLVVGEEGWPLEPDGSPSVKVQQAVSLATRGVELRVVQESDWLGFVGLTLNSERRQRRYTPAMLSQSLGVSVLEIRRWERLGLITPVARVCRLPYFDLQEVAGVRRLAALISAGVPPREIQQSLECLAAVIPGIQRPLSQLEVLSQDKHLVYRDQRGLLRTPQGQRLFEFDRDDSGFTSVPVGSADESQPDDEPQPDDESQPDDEPPPSGEPRHILRFPQLDAKNRQNAGPGASTAEISNVVDSSATMSAAATATTPPADDRDERSFDEAHLAACAAIDAGNLTVAETALRRCTLLRGDDADLNFQLADVLYRQHNLAGALERYAVAVELDRGFAEAWTQLGCVAAELKRFALARGAFSVAAELHPEYLEAHLYLGDVLRDLGELTAAREHWRVAQRLDVDGIWASDLQSRLETDAD